MKRLTALLGLLILLLASCAQAEAPAQIAATTLPVWEFTSRIVDGTGITVARLVTEPVSCLHDYSLNVRQVKAVEATELVVISGAGLEEFMDDLLAGKESVVDASSGIEILECTHEHDHGHELDNGHHHEVDSHIWLSPENAMSMARNICSGLSARYPRHKDTFEANLSSLLDDLKALDAYGQSQLADLTCTDLITFHDGFGYFAQAYDLHILEAVEEESGSEASAQELKHLITIVREHNLPAVFTECNGSASAAEVISRETGSAIFQLDMAMGGESYFEAMYHNIDTIKEALG